MSAESVSYVTLPQGAEARRPPMRILSGRGLRHDVEHRDERSPPTPDRAGDILSALQRLPTTATLRDVVEAVTGERPRGHSQTYANVVLTQRALARLAEAAAGRGFGAWEAE
jgi:hypothetical protein